MGYALLKRGAGVMEGQYYFKLYSDNGKVLCHSEFYKRRASPLRVLNKYFPGFRIVDDTKKVVESDTSE